MTWQKVVLILSIFVFLLMMLNVPVAGLSLLPLGLALFAASHL